MGLNMRQVVAAYDQEGVTTAADRLTSPQVRQLRRGDDGAVVDRGSGSLRWVEVMR